MDRVALTSDTLSFWGKAQPHPGSAATWHPVVAHSLDVAAVGTKLAPRYMPALPTALLGFLLSLHDLGKYSQPFQAKSEAHWPAVLGLWPGVLTGANHGEVGLHLLLRPEITELLNPVLPGWRASHRTLLFQALAGHHGRPVNPEPPIFANTLGPACLSAAAEQVRAMLAVFQPPPLSRPADLAGLCWQLAGLTMLADWVGSAQRWFARYYGANTPNLNAIR